MKNRVKYILISLLMLSGCIKNVLDRKPLNLISDSDVWQSKQLAEVYLTALYDALPIGFTTSPAGFQTYYTDESSYHEETTITKDFGNLPPFLNTTMYTWIRRANYFLEQIKTSTIADADKKSLAAECRFIRAYYYFDLVKKYGGMPIIAQVQTFDGSNLSQIQVPRNKEEDLYNFIAGQLDSAITDLPTAWDAANSNRATTWVALALKSRAMLYAGSIAKYGNVQLNGLLGIPAQKSTDYFNKSLEASKAIIDGHKFTLYTKVYDPVAKTGDAATNYQNIFIDKNNGEIIFQKAYSYPTKAHSYDNFNVPEGYTTNQGSAINPTLDMVESYEYIDGTPGTLKIDNGGTPIQYNSPDEIFANKDPRFAGAVFRGGSVMTPRNLQIWRGIYDTDGTLYNALIPFPKDPGRNEVGLDGPFESGNYSRTGFYIKKYLNTSKLVVEPNQSDQNYIDFRYAEMLLNYAEAAFETSTHLPEALDAINQIRSRAGIKLLAQPELTLARLRNERKIELAFEDKRFWDIKRWKIGTQLFQNSYVMGLWPYLKYQSDGSYKIFYVRKKGYPIDEGQTRLFTERDYYSNLGDYISTNNNIVQNTGW
jgi:hypothetical protein